MTILDIILIACFIPAVIQGLRKGFICQAISLVSIFAGIWFAVKFNPAFCSLLTRNFQGDERLIRILAFIALVLTGIIGLKLIGKLLTNTLSDASLGFVNRMVGVLFAILAYSLILGLLIILFDALNGRLSLVDEAKVESSKVYLWLRDFASKVIPDLKQLTASIKVPEIC